ncbi:MAG TPA: class I SAM-dependent methyltransferase [Propionibacteriaceae bacterium]
MTPDGEHDSDPAREWDPSLYLGSATHYVNGRVPYPPQIAGLLAAVLGLDGSGRLLDVGCGPGSLTLLLAPHFAEAVGIDADTEMLAVAAQVADHQGLDNVTWRRLRGEELPADLTTFRVVSFAQSFHWMDRARVAEAVRRMLEPDGVLVHVHATTHQGIETELELPHPRPPRAEIQALVQRYLGVGRRAGRGVLPRGTPGGEDVIYRAAGFTGPQRLEVPGWIAERTSEQVVSSIYSHSGSAPHHFGAELPAFDDQLRQLLWATSPAGRFAEQMSPVALDLWR